MLRELRIKNFAIIDRLSLSLKPGLNVLTGETGAGKSILIGALGVALGEKAYSEMIRTGTQEASVEAYFDISSHPLLSQMGIDSTEGIVLRRELSGGGKGRAYINDTMVNVSSLSLTGKTLVNIHGQHEHESLLHPETQMRLLDHYGRLEPLREMVSAQFNNTEALRKNLNDLRQNIRDRAQRIDLLRFQINEIDAAELQAEEDVSLEKEKTILLNLSRLNELAETAYSSLYAEEGSALQRLSSAISRLKEMSSIDPHAEESLNVLSSALPLIQEACASLRAIKDKYNLDPERLTEVDDRLYLIKALKKKYGDTISSILEYGEKIKRELALIEVSDEKLSEMEDELRKKEEGLISLGGELSDKRQKKAGRLESEIKTHLKELALEKADFRIDIKRTGLSANGMDSVEFLFSANIGEALKSLGRVASGGELSRVMLAIKSVLKDVDDIPTLIFDEVDAGIGGKTAQNLARKLKEISKGPQVICISHLPQIASLADNHILIEKKEIKTGVSVSVKELRGKERQEEIARMLSGKITETSLRHAREIIERSL